MPSRLIRKRKYGQSVKRRVQSYTAKRRRGTFRTRRRNPMLRRSLILSGFPNKKVVRLRYVTQRVLDAGGTNGIATCVIRANDLYDPEQSVQGTSTAGHQPMGFDQWIALYDHFTVVGAKITAKFINNTTAHVVPGMCGIMLTDMPRIGPTLTISTLEQLMENRMHTGVSTVGLVLGNTNSTTTKTMKFSARKFFGKRVLGEDIYRGSDVGSPTEQACFEVFYSPMGGAPAIGPQVQNDPGQILALITIDYIAVFTEPKPLNQS